MSDDNPVTHEATANYNLRYPTDAAPVDTAGDMKQLAEDTDAALDDKQDAGSYQPAGNYLTKGGTANVKLDNDTTTAKNWVASSGGTFTGTIAAYQLNGTENRGGARYNNVRLNHTVSFQSSYGADYPNATAWGGGNLFAFRYSAGQAACLIDGANPMIIAGGSDRRMKTNIEEYTSETGLSFIEGLDVHEFNYVDVLHEDYSEKTRESFVSPDKRVGLIYQDVPEELQVTPEIDELDGKPAYGSVNYLGVIPYLVSAVQELSQQNKELQQRVADLEADDA